MFGCASMSAVTSAENIARSTASAPPAATLCLSAAAYTCEPKASSSAFSMPAALSGFMLLSEFEQTSSAAFPVLCTGVCASGRISTRRTEKPRLAS